MSDSQTFGQLNRNAQLISCCEVVKLDPIDVAGNLWKGPRVSSKELYDEIRAKTSCTDGLKKRLGICSLRLRVAILCYNLLTRLAYRVKSSPSVGRVAFASTVSSARSAIL